ncbi:MAG: serine--tRNA ligase [Candidatus Goldbacteria bacterium]|nr:serine--tRNA ligase [Candidatus Goldiibacteriota bacterium]HPD18194.1 serine--tRNA ligase [Candidatus Goldiibacteriota bacterium]
MLDIKRIRDNPQEIKDGIKKKGTSPEIIDEILEMDKKRRSIIGEVERLKAKNNKVSGEIAKLKKEGKDTSDIIIEMKEVTNKIKQLDDDLQNVEQKLNVKLLYVPNVPHPSVPEGPDEKSNMEIRKWGKRPEFNFKPKPHWEIAEYLDILDNERAAKITGARFTLYKGRGALLERALINFMLDVQTKENGYTEIFPPILVNRDSMTNTGQLPKFENESFVTNDPEYFLIPTAEVPVTNVHKDETLKEKDLPIYYTAYTPCFRKEAGAYGKDLKGIVRMHQFNKVELVKFVHPAASYDELEKLVVNAESILQKLNLHYRVVLLSTGDMSFASSKTYDLEVWHPGAERYWEASSCSNFEDFQARRARIRFKDKDNKTSFVHTLNGSGLATSRLLPAIVENYQTENMEVIIPEILRPYMGNIDRITKK